MAFDWTKKGQSAIEFLATYGWVVLIIALVLVALGWLGVFSTTTQIQNRCAFAIGTVNCEDIVVDKIADGTLKLESITLRNDFDRPIIICEIACDAGEADPDKGWPINAAELCSSDPTTFTIPAGGTSLLPTGTLQPGQTLTLTSPAGIACKDAAGRADSYSVGGKYTGKLYVKYIFSNQFAFRILRADLVTTVQPPST